MVFDYFTVKHGLSARPQQKKRPNRFVLARLLGGEQVILSRGLCSFESRPLPQNVTGEKLRRSLELSARVVSPHERPGIFITIGSKRASIWTYDIAALVAENAIAPRSLIPESALHAPYEGFVLRQVLEGHEGQYWQDGELFASRWWSGNVTRQEWQRFCLSAEQHGASATAMPEPQLPARRVGIPVNEAPIASQFSLVSMRSWATLFAVIVALSVTYLGVRITHLKMQASEMQAEYQRLWLEKSDERAKVLAINTLRRKSISVSQYFNLPHPLLPLADALSAALEEDGRIERIFYDGYSFEVDFVRPEGFSQRDFVARLEGGPHVARVTLVQGQRADLWELTFSHTVSVTP